MKKILAILLTAIMVIGLAACSDDGSADGPSTGSTGNEGKETASNDNTDVVADEEIIIRVMDWNDSIKDQRLKFHEEFEAQHPNVKIEYTMLSVDQYKNTFNAAINSDEVPDLFMIPNGMDMTVAIEQGWVQSFNPYVEEDFYDSFMDGIIVEGVNMVDGEVYTMNNSISLPNTLIYYNRELFEQAGLDPDNPPKTYSELREAARVITEAGNGDYYGIIEGGTQVNRWTIAARDLSSLGGYAYFGGAGPVNLLTGKADFDSDVMVETFELFKGMAEDGSYHPSTMSISAPEARALFADGQAAMIMQGVWCIGIWHNDAPDLQIGVMPQVYPDSGKNGAVAANRAGHWLFLNAESENPDMAAEYFQAFFSDEYSAQKLILEAGAQFSPVKGLNEKYVTDEDLKEYYEAAMVHGVPYPLPKADNPDVAVVFSEYQDVSPNLGDLLQGTVAGAIPDIRGALATLSEKTDEALAKAIEKAADSGADVSIDDFIYSDWNPLAE